MAPSGVLRGARASQRRPPGASPTVTKRDYYEILGVDRDADAEQLKRAYRQLALRYHPDRNPDDAEAEERFKEASEAYAILSDREKRSAYDRFGFAGVSAGAGGSPEDFADFGNLGDVLNELFGDFFGTRRSRRPGRGRRGADLRYRLEIELGDLLQGTEAQLKIPKMRVCDRCQGSGMRPGSQPTSCEACGGVGQLVFQQGFFRVSRPCDRCGGAGQVVRDPCAGCRGRGRVEGQQSLQVKIPAGIENGTRLRLAGEGEAGLAGGPPGDLYVDVSVRPHPFFERDGTDLQCRVPIPFVQAALGAQITVPTLEGKETLSIAAGTQSGDVVTLRSRGLPALGSPRRGDLQVEIITEIPVKLTARQRKLLEQFAAESGSEVSPAAVSFLDKLRDFLGS